MKKPTKPELSERVIIITPEDASLLHSTAEALRTALDLIADGQPQNSMPIDRQGLYSLLGPFIEQLRGISQRLLRSERGK